MFPTIFTITLERSTASNAATSGLLCVAIIGGAILPFVTGRIIDSTSLHVAFLLPMTAYLLIGIFAAAASRARIISAGDRAAQAAH
jgi:FHS family L-fucose permease-like MFS transporter